MSYPSKRDELWEVLYAACLESATKMGRKIQSMSWFGKNHRQADLKKAA
jgi:hypothetical protein